MGNVQETVSDNKYDKDVNGGGLRDEYRAASVSVYDYYPFGMLMPGRSMPGTAMRCAGVPNTLILTARCAAAFRYSVP